MDITGTCTITQVNNYFYPAKDRTVTKTEAGHFIAHYLRNAVPKIGYEFVVALDGEIIDEIFHEEIRVPVGSNLVFAIVPKGGDGKNPLRILAMIAVIAIAAWVSAGSLAGTLGKAFGPETIGAYAAGAATSVVGGLLVNALFPVKPADYSIGGTGMEQSATYGWSTIGNPVQEGAVWPVLYGTMRVIPPIIGKYVSSEGDDQYLNLLYGVADHKVDSITNPIINDQGAANYSEVTIDYRLGSLNPHGHPAFFEETVAETSVGVPIPRKTFSSGTPATYLKRSVPGSANTGLAVGIFLPSLVHMDPYEGEKETSVDLVLEYSVKGADDWQRLQECAMKEETIVSSRWSAGYYRTLGFRTNWHEIACGSSEYSDHVEGESYKDQSWIIETPQKPSRSLLDDADSPIQTIQFRAPVVWRWITVSEVVQAGTVLYGGRYVRITGKTPSPIRRTYYKDGLTAAEYEVRVGYRTAPNGSINYQNTVYLEYIQGFAEDPFEYPGAAVVSIHALATENISGGLPAVSFLATRTSLDSIDGRLASNPAWAAYDILYSWGNVPKTKINFAAFQVWANYCDEKNLTCGIYFDAQVTVRQALDYLGTLGLARVVQLGTEYTVIVDKPDTAVQRFLFTPGNIERDSWQEEWSGLEDRANAIEAVYYDEENDYKRTTVFVQNEYFDEADVDPKIAKLDLIGCTNRAQAILISIRALNRNRYCTLTATWRADVDAIACQVGDVVECSHDVPQFGYGGRILVVTDSTHITLDREITFKIGTTYYITVKLADDTRQTKQLVNPGDGGSYAEVQIASAFSPVPEAHDLYVVGESETMTQQFRIVGIERYDDQRCTITGLEYNSDIYSDTANIDAPESKSLLEGVRNLRATEVYTGGSGTQACVTWTGAAVRWEVLVSVAIEVDGETVWQHLRRIPTTKTMVLISGLEYGIRYIFPVVPYPKTDEWKNTTLTLTGKLYPPGNVGEITTAPFEDGVTFSWNKVTDFDLRGYQYRTGTDWRAGKYYAVGDVVAVEMYADSSAAIDSSSADNPVARQYIVTTAGTSGVIEPEWPTSGTVNDGTVVWTEDTDNWEWTEIDSTKVAVALTARQKAIQSHGTALLQIWVRAVDAFGNVSEIEASASDYCLNQKVYVTVGSSSDYATFDDVDEMLRALVAGTCKKVHLKNGTYTSTIYGEIVLPADIEITGESKEGTIIKTTQDPTNTYLYLKKEGSYKFSNLTMGFRCIIASNDDSSDELADSIDFKASNVHFTISITLETASPDSIINFEGCTLESWAVYCIGNQSTACYGNIYINNCKIASTGAINGIVLDHYGTLIVTDCIFENTSVFLGAFTIPTSTLGSYLFRGCHFYQSYINIGAGSDINIFDNEFEVDGYMFSPIEISDYLGNDSRCKIRDNKIIWGGALFTNYGICVNGGPGAFEIKGNEIVFSDVAAANANMIGIYINIVDSGIIAGNKVSFLDIDSSTSPNFRGIYLTANSSNCIGTGNVISGADIDIYDLGTNNTINYADGGSWD